MTQKEAIDELILNAEFTIECIERYEDEHEDLSGDNPRDLEEELAWEDYKENLREIQALCVVLGSIDPKLGTVDGIKSRLEEIDDFPICEPSGIELDLHKHLCELEEEIELTDEENKELVEAYLRSGKKFVVGPEKTEGPKEGDTFSFYQYRGRVCVIYNESVDMNFESFPIEFQEKALEIVIKRVGK